tara:strand:- start:223 stop:528 length:306 start_codon:yes stop_codon:yes gene_type:complete
MGINIRFTVAVIVIIVVGFGGSFYLFSSGFMDGIKITSFDKSKYIEKIDQCISSQTAGHVSLNSFALSLADSLKQQIEETESEDTAKEILARLYDVTSCEP